MSGGASSIATTRRTGFIEADVRLRANLYYQQTTRFTIRYDLVGGAPRSTSPTRVGKAFSTFGVWAWGDPGRGTVEVTTPAGYATDVAGGPLHQSGGGSTQQRFDARPEDPETFFAVVTAEKLDAYSETRISFDGGVEIVVLAWPEDDEWTGTVSETLRGGIPKLRELIGLDWPVAHDLDVRERYTPALEGYAGVFFTNDQHIDVSEDLDPAVITHEASHAWFNEALFSERWIYEGLAEEYAWRTLEAIGADSGPAAVEPDPNDPGRLALVAWTFPQVIRDQRTDDRERYGYQASFWILHRIVAAVGVDRMREVFAAADAKVTAYPGAGAPEQVGGVNDWRRLLDLVSPIDAPEPAGVEEPIRELAITDIDARPLDDRRAARDAYRALVELGGGWLPPWYVRRLMGIWSFVGATKAIDQARAVLSLRDDVHAAAGALALAPDDALRTAYEGAQDGFAGATAIADEQLAALGALAEARAKVDGGPDLVAQIGLLGETPRTPYEAARSAFEAGQLADAQRLAVTAASMIGAAPAAGQARILTTLAVVIGLLLLVLLVRWLRRRRRQRALGHATATLAADPAAPPATPSATMPDDSGGPDPGDRSEPYGP